MTEAEMRDAEVPTFTTPKELNKYIQALVDQPHDYGTCCYAMSMAAVATFNFVASKLGVTGFQASCADLDIIKRTRRLDGPFMLVKFEDALYPQYNVVGEVRAALEEQSPWLADRAREELAKLRNEDFPACPNVVAHWEKLSAAHPTKEPA